jgi:Acetyltransferase (GNAT) domain
VALSLRPFEPEDAESCDQATLLHTRRFLSYHGDRFRDCSLVVEEEGRWVGLLPAAQHPADARVVVSHPGATYGGVLHGGALRGERMVVALEHVLRHYAAAGYGCFVYKAVPTFYHRRPAQDDLYALFRLGAERRRCDLSSTIDLACRGAVSERRRRSLKKARKAGVEVRRGMEHLGALWEVVADNLARKHGVSAVHTVDEMQLLMQRFPQEIRCVCAYLGGAVVAGVIVFATSTTDHAQYIASSATGYDVSALDAVFDECIAEALAAGKRWFDFGISTEAAGTRLNDSLYGFKTEFGGGGFVHDFYELALQGGRDGDPGL